MPDRRAADEQRAAGAVVWRPAGSGSQVALVHRPKYDDWSFPKGKLDPDEHVLLAAVREVAEETALQVTLGRRLPPVRYETDGAPKRVDYWVATVSGRWPASRPTARSTRSPGWPPSRASAQLSYYRDVETLADFQAGPRQTAPLILVRHASAGSKSDWAGSDMSRPLDARGKKDAERARELAALLRRLPRHQRAGRAVRRHGAAVRGGYRRRHRDRIGVRRRRGRCGRGRSRAGRASGAGGSWRRRRRRRRCRRKRRRGVGGGARARRL